MPVQLDLFVDVVTPEILEHAQIAKKEDILKLQTAIAFNPHVKIADRNKACELICRMNGYLVIKPQVEVIAMPSSIEIVAG